MNQGQRGNTVAAAELRREFDLSFAEAPATLAATLESFLAIRIAGDPYALRVSEIMGLHADRNIVPIPSPVPALLGIASFRGTVAPVYDLGLLLGYPSREAKRWLVLPRAPALVGLAFDTFEAHLRLSEDIAVSLDTQEHAHGHLRGVVRTGDISRRLIHIASLLEATSRWVSEKASKRSHAG